MPRGPKPKTRKNAAPRPVDAIRINDLVPTSELSADALDEFLRLARSLDAQGRLESVDIGVVTSTADDKAMLDRLNAWIAKEKGFPDEKHIASRNGVKAKWLAGMRALGLTVLPSRSVVKTVAKDPQKTTSPIAGKIKLA